MRRDVFDTRRRPGVPRHIGHVAERGTVPARSAVSDGSRQGIILPVRGVRDDVQRKGQQQACEHNSQPSRRSFGQFGNAHATSHEETGEAYVKALRSASPGMLARGQGMARSASSQIDGVAMSCAMTFFFAFKEAQTFFEGMAQVRTFHVSRTWPASHQRPAQRSAVPVADRRRDSYARRRPGSAQESRRRAPLQRLRFAFQRRRGRQREHVPTEHHSRGGPTAAG